MNALAHHYMHYETVKELKIRSKEKNKILKYFLNFHVVYKFLMFLRIFNKLHLK